jgi:hypothetical protein
MTRWHHALHVAKVSVLAFAREHPKLSHGCSFVRFFLLAHVSPVFFVL